MPAWPVARLSLPPAAVSSSGALRRRALCAGRSATAELHRRRPCRRGRRRVSGDVGLSVHASDVNDFFTGLEGSPRDTIRTQVKRYLDANPTVKDELTGIRQPLVDLKNRLRRRRRPPQP